MMIPQYILFISAAEIMMIVFIIVVFFGADKVPEIVRGLARTIKDVKHATNEIKSEITKTVVDNELDMDFTKDITNEITQGVGKEVEELKDSLEDITGPIKRRKR